MLNFKEYYSMSNRVNLSNIKLFDSETLFHEMAILNPAAIAKTQSALQFIHQHEIPGVLIGGMAVSHWTVDRHLTPDVDFLTNHVAQLKNILSQEKMPFSPLVSDGAFSGIQVPALDADFLDAHDGNEPFNQYILKTSKQTQIGGVSFQIIDPAVLTIMKFTLGRNKDTEDAFNLLKMVDKDALKGHLKALKDHLGDNIDASTIWGYKKAF